MAVPSKRALKYKTRFFALDGSSCRIHFTSSCESTSRASIARFHRSHNQCCCPYTRQIERKTLTRRACVCTELYIAGPEAISTSPWCPTPVPRSRSSAPSHSKKRHANRAIVKHARKARHDLLLLMSSTPIPKILAVSLGSFPFKYDKPSLIAYTKVWLDRSITLHTLGPGFYCTN